jgi:CRP-like cAMP-binding protein
MTVQDHIRSVIRNNPLFSTLKPEHVDQLLPHASVVSFEPGELIFQEGGPANQLLLIESGLVELSTASDPKHALAIQRVGTGEALGWSWLFPPFQWHFTARAVEATRAVAISGGQLLQSTEEHPDLGFEIMKRVSKVLIQRLQATRKQIVDHGR